MGIMRDFFQKLLGAQRPLAANMSKARLTSQAKGQESESCGSQPTGPQVTHLDGELCQLGDVIGGEYRIHSKLGEGGFGVVFLACHTELPEVVAIKTFRDELLADGAARNAFKKEALLWVGLEDHPFILSARWVREFSHRLFVTMDYVAPDEENRVTLQDHLRSSGGPFPLEQTAQWGVQLCYGMEHAAAHGIKCHRDIKPSNILVMRGRTPMVADFGLVAATEMARKEGQPSAVYGVGTRQVRCSLLVSDGHNVCGTPGYIAPEVYEGRGGDARSDIYSFGIVLWQMATGSPVSLFHASEVTYHGDTQAYLQEYQQRVYERQCSGCLPAIKGRLRDVIARCLEYESPKRYADFGSLRKELDELYRRATGLSLPSPDLRKKTPVSWHNKGLSLATLGRHEDAVFCYDQSLQLDPNDPSTLSMKGVSLRKLGRYEEAVCYHGQALQLDSRCSVTWHNMGLSLHGLRRFEDAIRCYDRATEIDSRLVIAWNAKGVSLSSLSRREEAICCFDRAIEIDPRDPNAWCNKGMSLRTSGHHAEAIQCLDRALQIDPLIKEAWNEKGLTFDDLGQYEKAIPCFDQAVHIDPHVAAPWSNMGIAFYRLGRHEDALRVFDRALQIDPGLKQVWNNKASLVLSLHRYNESIFCFNKLLEIDPQNGLAWRGKALSEMSLGRHHEAMDSIRKWMELSPHQSAEQTACVRQLLRSLKCK